MLREKMENGREKEKGKEEEKNIPDGWTVWRQGKHTEEETEILGVKEQHKVSEGWRTVENSTREVEDVDNRVSSGLKKRVVAEPKNNMKKEIPEGC